jgi:hypothetical protein
MTRPPIKFQLLKQSQDNFQKLNTLVDSIHDPDREFAVGSMNRNVRDVLAHIYHWHLMMLDWYEKGMQGVKPEIPVKVYPWKSTPHLNHKIWEDYNITELDTLREKLINSHIELTYITQKHSEAELFEKKKYKWTGSTSLGAYLIGATSSHYDWAIKLIKKGLS